MTTFTVMVSACTITTPQATGDKEHDQAIINTLYLETRSIMQKYCSLIDKVGSLLDDEDYDARD